MNTQLYRLESGPLGKVANPCCVSAKAVWDLPAALHLETGVFQNLETIQLFSWWTKSVQSGWYTNIPHSYSFIMFEGCQNRQWLRNQLRTQPRIRLDSLSGPKNHGESGAELARRCFRLEARGLSRGARGWRKYSLMPKFGSDSSDSSNFGLQISGKIVEQPSFSFWFCLFLESVHSFDARWLHHGNRPPYPLEGCILVWASVDVEKRI